MKIVLLNKLVKIQMGYQAKTRIHANPQGSHFLIQSKDFNPSHRLQTRHLVPFNPERRPDLYSVQKGDLLFQARGIEHFAYYVNMDLKNTLASSSFYILRIDDNNLLPQFLVWWLNQPPSQTYFRSRASGTGISYVSKSILSRLEVRIPPRSVQEKIVKIDTLARQEKDLFDKLSERRRLLINAMCRKQIH